MHSSSPHLWLPTCILSLLVRALFEGNRFGMKKRLGCWRLGLCQVMSGTTIMGTKTMLAGRPGFQSPEMNVLAYQVMFMSLVLYFLCCLATQIWPGL